MNGCHLADTSELKYVFQFQIFPSYWTGKFFMLHIHNLLDDAHSPHVLLHDFIVLDLDNDVRLQVIDTCAVCHKEYVPQVSPSSCSYILLSHTEVLMHDWLGRHLDPVDET